MPRTTLKGLPAVRLEYSPGLLPRVINAETNEEIRGVRSARVELLPDKVNVLLDLTASLLVETTNIGIVSSEYEALLRLARFLGDNLVVAPSEIREDLDTISHLLAPEAAHAAVNG